MRSKHIAVFLALFIPLLLPSFSHAASLFDGPKEISIQVVNSNGQPQPGATVWVEADGQATRLGKNSEGWVSPRTYSLGARVYASRSSKAMWSNFDPSTVPEGKDIFHQVSVSSPSSLQLVLPALDHPSYVPSEPEVSRDERVFVGLVNDKRQQLCVGALQISTTLSSVADRYANYLSKERGQGNLHYWYWDSDLRAKDGGWPGAATEALSWGRSDPESAYGGLLQSPPHYKILFGSEEEISDCNRYPRFIGASRVSGVYGPYWVVMLGGCGDPEDGVFSPACGATGDFGDSSLSGGDDEQGGGGDDSSLRVKVQGRSAGNRSVRLRVVCSHDCRLRFSGRARGIKRAVRTKRSAILAGRSRVVSLRYSKRLRRAVRRSGRTTLRLKISYQGGVKTTRVRLP